MITATKDQFIKNVKQIGECTIYFYDREPNEGENLKNIRKVHQLPKATATEQVRKINEFAENYPFRFYVAITKSAVVSANSSVQMLVDLGAETAEEIKTGVYKTPEEMEKDIRAKVLQEIEEKNRIEELEREREELRREKEELKTMTGKIYFLGNQLLNGILNAKKSNTMQGTNEVNNDKFEESLIYIIEALGGKSELIKLADKVKENPSILGMVKNFINS